MSHWQGYFQVACCGGRRGKLPGNVLVCSRCDYGPGSERGPDEGRVKDVAAGTWYIYPKDLAS
jgi:hypothetical protein